MDASFSVYCQKESHYTYAFPASLNEKFLHQAIKEIDQKIKEVTTRNIASVFEKVTGKAVKPNELMDMLNNLEEHGNIKADILTI